MNRWKQTRNLKRLARLYKKLEKKGGPEADGKLFELILHLEEETLALSALKASSSNTSILQSITTYQNTNTGVAVILSLLDIASAENADGNHAPLEILARGLAMSEDPFDVLPQMGISTHEYTLFLYALMRQGKASVIDAYNEMIRASDWLEPITMLKIGFEELKVRNINYLEAFLQSDLRYASDQEEMHECDS